MPALFNALLLASLLAFSHGLLKWIANQPSEDYWHSLLAYWWVFGLAIGIYGFIFFYYAYVLRTVAIGVLYPVYTGLSIVLVLLMGVWLFGEPITFWQVAGCVLIAGGIFLVTGGI
jgi:multidrug transporter EmrE-like cation transporter